MDTFLSMSIFRRVVETGSFSAMAREIGLSQPTNCKHVVALEERLGALRVSMPIAFGRIQVLPDLLNFSFESAFSHQQRLDHSVQSSRHFTLFESRGWPQIRWD